MKTTTPKTKKVFSLRKYKKWLRETLDYTPEQIEQEIKYWAQKCEGLTEEEMNEIGFACTNTWIVRRKIS